MHISSHCFWPMTEQFRRWFQAVEKEDLGGYGFLTRR